MKIITQPLLFLVIIILIQNGFTQTKSNEKTSIQLSSVENLQFVNAKGSIIEYNGESSLRVSSSSEGPAAEDLETLVVIPEIKFSNGIIEVEVSGEPAPGASPLARGFVGIAFRVNKGDKYEYECFYIRPLNGRAENQIQRNHSAQYISHPEHPWHRLRKEFPEMYESYVDLEPGKWTKLKIDVVGTIAKFFVNDSQQPNLIVKDLKHGESEGAIALWLHSSTIAHFRNLVIQPNKFKRDAIK